MGADPAAVAAESGPSTAADLRSAFEAYKAASTTSWSVFLDYRAGKAGHAAVAAANFAEADAEVALLAAIDRLA